MHHLRQKQYSQPHRKRYDMNCGRRVHSLCFFTVFRGRFRSRITLCFVWLCSHTMQILAQGPDSGKGRAPVAAPAMLSGTFRHAQWQEPKALVSSIRHKCTSGREVRSRNNSAVRIKSSGGIAACRTLSDKEYGSGIRTLSPQLSTVVFERQS